MLTLKKGVTLKGITPEMAVGVVLIAGVFTQLAVEGCITSVGDGVHMTNSKHYKGNAVDLRSKTLADPNLKATVVQTLRYTLGEQFDVILEQLGQANEHIHVEYDPVLVN